MDLPHRFGRYELLELLATGGMAEIYRARSFGVDGFEKHLVVKRILPGLARDPRFVGLFVKEARLGASLCHPNLVQVYELGRVGDDHYMAMEHVHGRDLARVSRALRRQGARMPVAVAVHVAVCALRALHCAHGLCGPDGAPLGLVHRDVSPHNLMLGFEGEVKLFDFGIAGLEGEDGVGGGKHGYRAPEQLDGGRADARTDIFAVGIVLWELITGRRLFGGSDLAAKRAAVAAAAVPDPRQFEELLPDALAEAILDMLARDPDARPATAERAAERLTAALFPAVPPADARQVRALLRGLFPDVARRPAGATVDLGGLARDLAALAADRPDGAPAPGSEPPSSLGTGSDGSPSSLGRRGGARKTVVVLTGEVVGLTDVTLQQESERIVRHNLRFLRQVRRVVGRHGGLLESWQDDTFVAFFGLPRTREHDLERALACAAEIRDVARKVLDQAPRTDVVLGVHTGEISVGRRAGRRLRYLAHGDTMKLCRRLCMEGDLGEVLVSDLVARLARRRWHLARGPRVRLRGSAEPVQSWRLLRPRRRVETAGGRWMPRKAELDQLRAALASLEEGPPEAVQGGLLAVVGSAGAGKSRLLRELGTLARRRGVGAFAVRGLPYQDEQGQLPLRVVRELGAAILGLDPAAPREERAQALARLDQLELEPVERAALRRLFPGAGDRPGPAKRSPRTRPVPLVARLIAAVAATQPLILAVEDTQYIDPPTLLALAALLEATRGLPVLWWISGRALGPTLPPPDWCIRLERLDRGLVARLCAELLGTDQLDPLLLRRIDRASEGNPLFVESLISALLREGRLELDAAGARLRDPQGPLPAPPDLEALVAERVDRLDPALKGMLQLAAVVGGTVPLALLREASQLDQGGALIDELLERGLLVVDVARPSHLLFGSPLVWTVVHRSLLARERRAAHGAVARAIERLHGADLSAHWDRLSRHCAGAGRLLDAARSARRAGTLLAHQQLLESAADTFERALGWVLQARAEGEDEEACAVAETVLSLEAGASRAMAGQARSAERHLQLALEGATELWMPEVEGRAQLELGDLYRALGRTELCRAHLDGALESARTHPGEDWSLALELDALESLGEHLLQSGENDDARRIFGQARARSAGDPVHTARAQLGLANLLLRTGDMDDARALLEEARAAARAVGDRILEGRAVNNIGIVHHSAGAYDQALACFQESRRIRESLGYRRGVAVNLHNIGDTRARMGERALAWAAFNESRSLAREMRWRQGVVMNELWLAWLEADTGAGADEPERATGRLRSAIERARAVADDETVLTGRWLLGRLLAAQGRLGAARAELGAARREALALDAQVLARDLGRALDGLPAGEGAPP